MIDRWGEEGPPPEAYSRVSRDLTVVTAGFASYLDALPGRLTTQYHCVVRPLDENEAQRLQEGRGDLDPLFALQPETPGAAVLLVGRRVFLGGTSAMIGVGQAWVDLVPPCSCDACDEDSESMVEAAQRLVRAVVGGFEEFRRTYRAEPGQMLHKEPWMEHGYCAGDGGQSSAGHSVLAPFEVTWTPWTPRD